MNRRKLREKSAAVCAVSLITLLAWLTPVPTGFAQNENRRLPHDTGIVGLAQALRKLRTTARLMHTTAHPDDEDGGMLTLISRGLGATALQLTLNRGEGGQNKTGSELFDALGILRTLELLAAGSHYGVEQRFTRVVDFGFSKNADETFQMWQGRDVALADMVRVIRTFRPDVIISRFQGAPRDNHGNHQASGIVSREAFRAAGDPNRFPEQLKEGLQAWQPKKLYVNNVRADEECTIRLNSGTYDPLLGKSYSQLAIEGLGHQLSQGVGAMIPSPGDRFSLYKLVESLVPTPGANGGKEQSFFDGIDTTLPGLAARLGDEESKVPFLKPSLIELDQKAGEAQNFFTPLEPTRTAAPLLAGLRIASELINRIESSSLSPTAKADLLVHLRTKQNQFEAAANLALGVIVEAFVDSSGAQPEGPPGFPRPQQTLQLVYPGQTFTLTARLYNRSDQPVTADDIQLDVPNGWTVTAVRKDLKLLGPNQNASVQFRVTVPADAAYTRPYWHRDDPQSEGVYKLASPEYATLPFTPPPVAVRAIYNVAGEKGVARSTVRVRYIDPMYGEEHRPLLVGPPMAVELQPNRRVLTTDQHTSSEVKVAVHNNVTGAVNAVLRLEAPTGWRVEPPSQPITFTRDGESNVFNFKVTPGSFREGRYDVKAVVEYDGKRYAEGFTLIGRREIGWLSYYRPAVQTVSAVAVKLPKGLKVGYIMGAGDEIPDVLKQIGMDVEMINPAELTSGDLSRFHTIIVGIRAYDVSSEVREHNKRLLDFVERGGTLIVQYNTSPGGFNAGNYTPYPATLGNGRVTVEDAPVELLAPQDSVFHYPNEITAKDFTGWVQERGLYFMQRWDDRFTPLLASQDPGEQPLKGGLLRANYGKGTYIYTGYAFFRQLPAGVPGAIRLFVNLMSLSGK